MTGSMFSSFFVPHQGLQPYIDHRRHSKESQKLSVGRDLETWICLIASSHNSLWYYHICPDLAISVSLWSFRVSWMRQSLWYLCKVSDLEWILGNFEAKSHASQKRRGRSTDRCEDQDWANQNLPLDFFELSLDSFFFLKSSPEDMLINFRKRGQGKKEREKHPCERETPISCLPHMPNLGLKLQPRYVTWWGIEPTTFGQ